MKKNVLLILLFVCSISFGQTIPTFYFDLIQFQNDAGNLVTEDFTGGPGGDMNNCGSTISSNGDGCFPAAEIEEGFNLTTTNNTDLTLYGIDFYPNQTMDLVGSSDVSETMILSFTQPVFAVGITLYTNQDEFILYQVFDTDDNIIDDASYYIGFNDEYFLGVISSVAIGKIEMVGEANNDLLIGSLSFTAQNGSGGPSVCGENNTSNGFETGYSYSAGQLYAVANDLTVASGEDFELQQIIYNSYHVPGETINSVDINYYSGAGGLPGTLIGTQTGVVPTSQTFINFDPESEFDVSEITLDINPVLFEGSNDLNTTYWIELANAVSSGGGLLAWELSSNTVNGNPSVSHELEDDVRTVIDQDLDGVYTWNGECSVLGTADHSIEGFTYYPNPTHDTINLNSIENIENVIIYNMLGQKIMAQDINSTISEVNISSLTIGTYLMQVSINGKTGTYQVLKQ